MGSEPGDDPVLSINKEPLQLNIAPFQNDHGHLDLLSEPKVRRTTTPCLVQPGYGGSPRGHMSTRAGHPPGTLLWVRESGPSCGRPFWSLALGLGSLPVRSMETPAILLFVDVRVLPSMHKFALETHTTKRQVPLPSQSEAKQDAQKLIPVSSANFEDGNGTWRNYAQFHLRIIEADGNPTSAFLPETWLRKATGVNVRVKFRGAKVAVPLTDAWVVSLLLDTRATPSKRGATWKHDFDANGYPKQTHPAR
ncbi:hypothetical protein P170DRAFT_469602 [Aspergillus steynii IBT 23096]|uniref:Uncharacterized protein n=1 Tax=Aspergillus steynii IBT 23096 TaxID=1392250 RepID=A0A2I2GML1_9EURO|nr:uncharacterized protein P170DRAFT_469602 [Aspergillus steynii IBT 23096]PLB54138.1 hypothetical protein P170DRAFT_469602 [Aspergillus steynii IBT 23096]